jgi:hypothetical protein
MHHAEQGLLTTAHCHSVDILLLFKSTYAPHLYSMLSELRTSIVREEHVKLDTALDNEDKKTDVRFQVITEANMKMTAFWDIAPYLLLQDYMPKGSHFQENFMFIDG